MDLEKLQKEHSFTQYSLDKFKEMKDGETVEAIVKDIHMECDYTCGELKSCPHFIYTEEELYDDYIGNTAYEDLSPEDREYLRRSEELRFAEDRERRERAEAERNRPIRPAEMLDGIDVFLNYMKRHGK